MVKPIRHVLHLADLSKAESAELGPLLHQTAAAVTEVMDPEQVYTCLWSHAGAVPGHIHFVVQPITLEVMTRFSAFGPGLQTALFREGTLPDPDEVTLICARIRTASAWSSSS
ncbi:HIT family protein [Actinomadura craniellae]|uniref:HIT family protein n=1 Tax=Actinomadura craniellae TaxID=2231787 RepID=UPI0018F23476|nr:hypothetical protein [Actinomadura craniellae]